ncbi:hypothetical protein ACS7SF_13440 [Ralstonia sp. 25C]|uniref:hypothetical protein n=1 Tax=Ralstonia sp. 25C TaxID=3447363 RepID=UPI003F75074B
MTAQTSRPSHPLHQAPERLAVAAGCASVQWWPSGTTLIVLEGRATLVQPAQWVADQTLRPHQPLSAGHALVLDRSGWWGLQADAGKVVQLQIVLPAAAASRLRWSALRQWLFGWAVPRQTSRG